MRRLPKLVFAAALTTLMIAVAACGGKSDTGNTNQGDKTLRFAGFGAPIRSWDPHRDGRPASNLLLFAVYDRLIHQSPDGKLIPGLALEWKFTDPTTFEMKLRSGVTFHDGTEFNAEAVKANIQRAKTIDNGAGPWAGPLGVVDTVEVVDPSNVRFKLKTASASLPALLSDAAGAMVSPAAFTTVDLNSKDAGAGMYKLEKWATGGSATFVAYDKYWDPKAIGFKKIEMPFQLDQLRRLDMLKAGAVDATFGHTTFVDGAIRANLDVKPQAGINSWVMNLNRTVKPFDDSRVRLAIAHAIDRQSLIKAVLAGQADDNQQPFAETSEGFDKTIGKTPYDYNVDKAKQLLAEAGYANGLNFTCAVVGGSGGAYAQYLEVVKDQLAKIGVNLEIKLVESVTTALLVDKSVNCAVMPYGVLSPIVAAKQLFGTGGYMNAGKVAEPGMDKLVAALDQPQDDKALSASFDAVMKQVIDEGLYISLFYEKWAVVSSKNVKGLQFYVGGHYTEFRNISAS
ncbi:ABC transporter substrate-binding protein [Dactylosporangium salmoneum]|uniref:ABC transporter substrate-binding protein n=1 Tax=Dactylosporangium salmoneum TaxID=53361 RepID=A0ABP5TT85_9ACTN